MSEPLTIACDLAAGATDEVTPESWVDLRVGETATVLGRLAAVTYKTPAIMIEFSDWSDLIIELDTRDASKSTLPIMLRSLVAVRVERTEDGLRGLAIWEYPGGVPIPLVSA